MKNQNSYNLVKRNIIGTSITDAKRQKVLEYVIDIIKETKEKLFIVTPNPEIIVYANKRPGFQKILNSAQLALADGVGVILAGKLLGKPIEERITGVSFMEELCKESVRNAVTVGFLGGKNLVAERTAHCLQEKYPGLQVVFIGEEWPEQPESLSAKLKGNNYSSEKLNAYRLALNARIDVLFVAFGFPKQEEWMYEHIDKLNVRVMLGVGGAFDYLSGEVPRAPKLVQAIGCEWLYRLIHQPWRWKRQLALMKFVRLVMKEKFRTMVFLSRGRG